jgi:linoleoyl-CoA desaturase
MTALQKKAHNPIGHLTAEDVEQLGRELDAIREQIIASRGERDAAYIRKVIDVQRKLELSSRAILLFSLFPPAWLVGTAGLSISKILENMEIGTTSCTASGTGCATRRSTRRSGSGTTPPRPTCGSTATTRSTTRSRTCSAVTTTSATGSCASTRTSAGRPFYLGQPLWNFLNACFFEYGIAAYDLEIGKYLKGRKDEKTFKRQAKQVLAKIKRQATRDYVVHPLLSGPSFLHTVAANATANLVRNLWTHSVIMCGHFPEGVETFEKTSIDGETRGEWYLRQMLGAANITGSKAMHMMTGNLSFQIEHHLYPDLPSNRYKEISPKIQELFERYGLTYVTGPFPKQLASAWKTVIRLSLPNDFMAKAQDAVVSTIVPGTKAVPAEREPVAA